MSGLLSNLFVTPTLKAIEEALASAKADGRVAVIHYARLAKALGGKREVVPVAVPARSAKKLAGCVAAIADVEPRSLAAVVAGDLAEAADWEARMRAWSGAVRDGGVVILIDDGKPAEVSRRALCGGLTELAQRRVGRQYVTSGLVTHL